MAKKLGRRGLLRFLGGGAAGAGALAVAGVAEAKSQPQTPYPVGTTGWAHQQMAAGRRVRQRCWKDGQGAQDPSIAESLGHLYEKGIQSMQGLHSYPDMLFGDDWELVP